MTHRDTERERNSSMTFRELVTKTRLRKKSLDPKAYTQSACGSRMTDGQGNSTPISQVGWSRYETDDNRPAFDTVIGIANALNEPPAAFLRAAGYPVPNELEPFAAGTPVLLQEEVKRREQEEMKRKLETLEETVQQLKRMLTAVV